MNKLLQDTLTSFGTAMTSSKKSWTLKHTVRLKIAALLLRMSGAIKPKTSSPSSPEIPSIKPDSIQHWFPLLSPEFVAFLQEKGFSHLPVYTVIEKINVEVDTPYTPREAHERDVIMGEQRLLRIQEVLDNGSYVSPGNTNLGKILPELMSSIRVDEEVQGTILDLFKHALTIADLYILGSDGIQGILAQVPEQYESIIRIFIEQLLQSFSYIGTSNGEPPESASAPGTQDTIPSSASITTNNNYHYPQKPGFSRIRAMVYGSVLLLLALERGYINKGNIKHDIHNFKATVLRVLNFSSLKESTPPEKQKVFPEDDVPTDAGDVPPDDDLPWPPEEPN